MASKRPLNSYVSNKYFMAATEGASSKKPVNPYMTKKHIFAATERNDLRALKHYVEKIGLSLKNRNNKGQTAAHIAATNENLPILKFLLTADNSVLDYRDIGGKNVLHVAVERGSLNLVKFLVDEMGADPIATNRVNANNSALHIAAEHGHLPILRFLVGEKKVQVDARNEAGETAIFLAAEKPHVEVIQYLAGEAKANLTLTDEKNEHVLFVSARVGDLQVPKYLLEKLKADIDVNWRDAFGYTLAHVAAQFDHLECLKYFVEGRGAQIDVRNNDGWTPLHEAASAGFLEVIEYLLKRGADAGAKNKAGKTPLKVATENTVKKYLKEAVEKRRSRRSVIFQPPLLTAMTSITGPQSYEILDTRIADRLNGTGVEGESPGISIEASPSHVRLVLGLLTFANTIARRRQPETVFSPASLFSIDDKMDPNIVDAVSGAFGFGE